MPKTRKKTNKVKHKARVRATSKKLAKEQKDTTKKAKREKKAEPLPLRGQTEHVAHIDDGGFSDGPAGFVYDDGFDDFGFDT